MQAVMKTMSYLKHMLSLEVQLDFNPHVILSLAWDQAPQWGRRQKPGEIGKIYIGERSKPSGGLGSGDGRLSSHADFFHLFPPMRSLIPGYTKSID